MDPLLRLIVVNFNGGEMTIRCLENLLRCDWDPERLEVVLVDNASSDCVVERVRESMPRVRVIETGTNLGFAGGANAGLRDLGDVAYVALVNNDAFPERGWLRPLVDAIEDDPKTGAAAPKILLAPQFASVKISSPTFQPGTHDPRPLGVMVSGVRVGSQDRFDEAVFRSGFLGPEDSPIGPFQWTSGDAELWCPVDNVSTPATAVEVRLHASKDVTATVSAGDTTRVVEVTAAPQWHRVAVGAPFDVINNVGSRLVEGGWAGDRGYLEVDRAQYEAVEEVFGWCGAAAVLSRGYVEDVGLFDPALFLYYEDTDLSWRGRLRGWRYVYVPSSRVRHVHSATSGEGSAVFTHYVDRNRLLVYLRNAPARDAAAATAQYVREMASIAVRDIVRPTLLRHPRHPLRTKQKARSLAGVIRRAPAILTSRARQSSVSAMRRSVVAEWAVPS